MVSKYCRFATISGGRIIGVGDTLGRRLVVAIDEKAVVLREPSGVRVRVGWAAGLSTWSATAKGQRCGKKSASV